MPQEILVKKQAERIEELRKENSELVKQLEEYRNKEREISETVVFAKRKQEEYLADLRIRYALENERLKKFCEAMECYKSRDELLKAYDQSFSAVKKAREELSTVLQEELGTGASIYLAEKKRIGDDETPFSPEIKRSDLNKVSAITEEELQELLDQI